MSHNDASHIIAVLLAILLAPLVLLALLLRQKRITSGERRNARCTHKPIPRSIPARKAKAKQLPWPLLVRPTRFSLAPYPFLGANGEVVIFWGWSEYFLLWGLRPHKICS